MDKLMDKGVGQQVRACAAYCLRAQSARQKGKQCAHLGRSLQTLMHRYFRTARPMPACLPASHAANRLLQQIRSHAAHAARRGAFHVDRKGAGPAERLPSDAWCWQCCVRAMDVGPSAICSACACCGRMRSGACSMNAISGVGGSDERAIRHGVSLLCVRVFKVAVLGSWINNHVGLIKKWRSSDFPRSSHPHRSFS